MLVATRGLVTVRGRGHGGPADRVGGAVTYTAGGEVRAYGRGGQTFVPRVLGTGQQQEFEVLMDTMPTEYLVRLPETRFDSPFVIRITPAGVAYLESERISSTGEEGR